MNTVTVVIPAYNASHTLGLQLESLAHQVGAPPFDVLVVDNGSTEPLDGVVSQWADTLAVRLLRADRVQGVAYARNVGLANACGDHVLFLDADDCAGPGFVAAASQALMAAPFVTGNVVPLPAEVFDQGRGETWRGLESSAVVSKGCPPVLDAYPVYMGGASAVRRKDAIELGAFDQSFVPGAEDNDFGLRVRAAGYTLVRCEGMILAERRRATSKQAMKRSYEAGRMHMRLCAVHDLWRVSPHLNHPTWWVDLMRLPGAGARVIITGRSAAGLQGWSSRAGLRLGQAAGFVRFRLLHRLGRAQLGLGLDEVITQ